MKHGIELCYIVKSRKTGEEVKKGYGKFSDMDDFYSYMSFRYGFNTNNYHFVLSGREFRRYKSMTYRDFYKIANYLNECNNNIFSNEEIACYAYDYLIEYEQSMVQKMPTYNMIVLCIELIEDMDCHDYDDTNDIIDLYTMEKILEEFLENY